MYIVTSLLSGNVCAQKIHDDMIILAPVITECAE